MSADAIQLLPLPKLYENMDEATIGAWLIDSGAPVSEGQPIVELITDKSVIEYESPHSGHLLAQYASVKSTVPIGYVLAAIGPEGATAPDVSAQNQELLEQSTEALGGSLPAPPPEPPKERPRRLRVAPAARAYAKKHDIDLDAVAATTDGGVIHRQDVEAYQASQAAPTPQAAPAKDGDTDAPPVALITGASGDIGSAIALQLAAAGHRIAIHYHQQEERARELLTTLREQGHTAAIFQADLTDAAAAKGLVTAVHQHFQRLDTLVNNAGLLDDAILSFMNDSQWQRVLDTNLSATFYLTRAAAMIMARQRAGAIINITSDAGRLGGAGRVNYSAAKAGISGLTRAAARELAGSGIRVNAVSPGFVESRMTAPIKEKRKRDLLREIPLRRFAEPADVAALVAFLASSGASYITGQEISVDGGLYMG